MSQETELRVPNGKGSISLAFFINKLIVNPEPCHILITQVPRKFVNNFCSANGAASSVLPLVKDFFWVFYFVSKFYINFEFLFTF